MEINLVNFKKSVYSADDQDGIIEKIFKLIGFTNKYFVEFGSEGRKNCGGNTAYLREKYKFDGLLMDGLVSDSSRETRFLSTYNVHEEIITAENINQLFKKYKVPGVFDFLSIDIDGEDYWVMYNLDTQKFKPRIICIETNESIHPDLKIVQRHNPEYMYRGGKLWGCSSSAMTQLLNKKNYTLVAYTGGDCIFVHNDELKRHNLKFKNENNPYKIGCLHNSTDRLMPIEYFKKYLFDPPDWMVQAGFKKRNLFTTCPGSINEDLANYSISNSQALLIRTKEEDGGSVYLKDYLISLGYDESKSHRWIQDHAMCAINQWHGKVNPESYHENNIFNELITSVQLDFENIKDVAGGVFVPFSDINEEGE